MDILTKLFGIKYRSGIYYNPRTNKIAILEKGFIPTTFSIEHEFQKICYVAYREVDVLQGYVRLGSF